MTCEMRDLDMYFISEVKGLYDNFPCMYIIMYRAMKEEINKKKEKPI